MSWNGLEESRSWQDIVEDKSDKRRVGGWTRNHVFRNHCENYELWDGEGESINILKLVLINIYIYIRFLLHWQNKDLL